MNQLCANCNVCIGKTMPEQVEKRVLRYTMNEEQPGPSFLVIDNHFGGKSIPLVTLSRIFGKIPVTYTHTIRCTHSDMAHYSDLAISRDHCAAWTKQLLSKHGLFLSTEWGLIQMGIEPKEGWTMGKVYKSPAHGLILFIYPLESRLSDESIDLYATQVQRMLRSVKTGEKL